MLLFLYRIMTAHYSVHEKMKKENKWRIKVEVSSIKKSFFFFLANESYLEETVKHDLTRPE